MLGPGSILIVWNWLRGIDETGLQTTGGIWTVDIWTCRAWPTASSGKRKEADECVCL